MKKIPRKQRKPSHEDSGNQGVPSNMTPLLREGADSGDLLGR